MIVSQQQPDLIFDLPLDLAVTTASGSTVQRHIHLTRRVDTLDVRDGAATDVRVDPDHYFLLQRHMGEQVVRFELPAAAVPEAKVVELTGNFAGKPVPATRVGDAWVLELPMTEGRYIWQWRVDGVTPNDEATFAAVMGPPDPAARAGVRWVKPIQRVTDAYPR